MSLCNDSFIRRTNDSSGQEKERKSLHRRWKVGEELIRSGNKLSCSGRSHGGEKTPLTSSKSLQCTDTEVETAWPSEAEGTNMRERPVGEKTVASSQKWKSKSQTAAATTLL